MKPYRCLTIYVIVALIFLSAVLIKVVSKDTPRHTGSPAQAETRSNTAAPDIAAGVPAASNHTNMALADIITAAYLRGFEEGYDAGVEDGTIWRERTTNEN